MKLAAASRPPRCYGPSYPLYCKWLKRFELEDVDEVYGQLQRPAPSIGHICIKSAVEELVGNAKLTTTPTPSSSIPPLEG